MVLFVDLFSLGVFAYGVGYAVLKYDGVDLLNVHDRTIKCHQNLSFYLRDIDWGKLTKQKPALGKEITVDLLQVNKRNCCVYTEISYGFPDSTLHHEDRGKH